MTEMQSWVLIGVFTTLMLGSLAAMTGYFRYALASSLEGLHGELRASTDGLRSEIQSVRSEIQNVEETLRAEIAASEARTVTKIAESEARTGAKIDALDRDVRALTRHVFGDDRPRAAGA